MEANMAKLFEGNVAIVPVKVGSDVFKLVPKGAGKHSAADTIVAAIKANKLKMSGWSIWADGFDAPLAKGADVSFAAFTKLVKEATTIELVLVKGAFPQPKLKITKGEGSQRPTKAAAPKVEY
jgi:hypothetical protein